MFLSRLFDGRSIFGGFHSVNKAIDWACAAVIEVLPSRVLLSVSYNVPLTAVIGGVPTTVTEVSLGEERGSGVLLEDRRRAR